ncbi:MAG TPA: hypothetical protein PLU99_00255 [Phycisphaerae bacterium]|jgi:outer membrane lipoprotein-sorting protein|nr:hypothetical protein [Phycisphaerae bacterium]HRS28300.1 hypothetical protein [Phycisphaerae bacterium]
MSMRSVLRGLNVCALLVSGAALVRAETVDEVSRMLTEKMRAVTSLSAKTQTVAEMSSPGYSEQRVSKGVLELLRKDGKVFLRNESREVVTSEAAGQTVKQEGMALAIMDGTGYVYSYMESGDQKTAYKKKSQVDWDADPIEGLKALYDIELLPEETIDGAAVCVFKLTPKAGSGGEGSALEYFRKDCGYPVKIVHFDAAGKAVMTATYTDIKLNQEISPERFVFNTPPGVELVDLTEVVVVPPEGPAAATASAPAASEAGEGSVPATQAAAAPEQAAPAEAAGKSPEPRRADEKAKPEKKGKAKKGDAKKDGKKGKQKAKP